MYTVKEVSEMTVKELQVVAEELKLEVDSKMKKDDLSQVVTEAVEEAIKSLPVDGPTAVQEAVDSIKALLPEGFFEETEDTSTKRRPCQILRVGQHKAAGNFSVHIDFGVAGTKKAKVSVVEKCFGQANAAGHLFPAAKPEMTARYLKVLNDNRF